MIDEPLFRETRRRVTRACGAFATLWLIALIGSLLLVTPPASASNDEANEHGSLVGQSNPVDFYAVLHDDGQLVFQADNASGTDIIATYEGNLAGYDTAQKVPWLKSAASIKSVRFDDSFRTLQPRCLRCWFYGCSKMTEIDLTNLDASKSTTMQKMFMGCSSLERIGGLDQMDTSSSTYFGSMFNGCSSLKSLDVSHFNATNVEVLCFMFNGCSSLETLNMHGEGWRTSSLGLMVHVWEGCTSLKSLDLSYLDTSGVRSMTHDFDGCSSLEYLDLSGAETSHTINLVSLFDGCDKLTKVKLGPGFSFNGGADARQCSLPEGMWKSSVNDELFAHDAIPNNVGATYTKANGNNVNPKESGSASGKAGEQVGATVVRAGMTYRITSNAKPAVQLQRVSKRKSKATIPAVIAIDGKSYAVTGIAKGAFRGTKVKTIIVKTKKLAKKSVRGCFKGASKLKVVKVPKSKKRAYRVIFKKSNSGRAVKVH